MQLFQLFFASCDNKVVSGVMIYHALGLEFYLILQYGWLANLRIFPLLYHNSLDVELVEG